METRIKKHEDHTNTVYMHIGNKAMFTLSDGTVYGEALEEYVYPETMCIDQKPGAGETPKGSGS